MNWKALGSALLIAGALTSAAIAQNIPANKVYRGTSDSDRGDWEPNAHLNPSKPVQIVLINSFGEAFRYILTGHTNVREIPNGKTAKLTKVPLPAYLDVNPTRDNINIRYKVSVDEANNTIILELKPAKGFGQRSLEIDAKGAIFAY